MTTPNWTLLEGDVRERLADIETGSVQTCITSPPYWQLRDYGTGSWEGGDPECDHRQGFNNGRVTPASKTGQGNANVTTWAECGRCGATRVDRQIGLEPTVGEYVETLVGVFREVRRTLRDDGTLWLNLGDSYVNRAQPRTNPASYRADRAECTPPRPNSLVGGLKAKDLAGVPWRVALALQDDGWYLRADVIWAKTNPMPESTLDRPTRSHEYLFLLSKRPRYFYDAYAIREGDGGRASGNGFAGRQGGARTTALSGVDGSAERFDPGGGRNKRDVWTVSTQPYPGAHFAVFPPKLIEPCVLAGSSDQACGQCGAPWERVLEPTGRLLKQQNGGPGTIRAHVAAKGAHGATSSLETGFSQERATTGFRPTCGHDDPTSSSCVLDPFAGAGTTAIVSLLHGRRFIGIELNADYAALARDRIHAEVGLFAST